MYQKLIIILLLVCLSIGDERSDTVKQIRRECVADNNISSETLNKFRKWEFPEENNVSCYMRCFMNKLGLFDDTNGLNVEEVIKHFTRVDGTVDIENLRSSVNECATTKSNDLTTCDWASVVFRCVNGKHSRLIIPILS